jgi:Tfp pilus assembly protein PilF
MEDPNRSREQALALFREAYRCQREGRYDQAIQLYTESILVFPTAEALTFRGWAKSFRGQFLDAIADCHSAIEVDPSYGNPYNDIGAYLIELGRCDEAISWLEKAIHAPRYEARCYPFMNLGRIFMSRGELRRARLCFTKSLEIQENFSPALRAIDAVERLIN